jgi:ectoine hydroxylase-related dioxygenase (phytanoyl-CoA dioxygenase family)
MTTHEVGPEPQAVATLEHLPGASSVDDVCAVLERDGAVIVEDLLSSEIVAAINTEVEATVRETDPDAGWFNDVMKEFHGPNTRAVSGVPGISPTFAVEAMCHPLLLGVCDRVLLPSCARYQLNLGQILQRGPGSPDQILHRDEVVWADVPRPAPELQLATVIAFVDFTAENGATRVVPGSHHWDDRALVPIEQILRPPPEPRAIAQAVMPAGSAVVYLGGTIHGAGANVTEDQQRRGAHLSYCMGWLRTEENNYLSIPPGLASRLPRQAQEVIGYAVHDGIPRGGGYLGMLAGQDPVELLGRGDLTNSGINEVRG